MPQGLSGGALFPDHSCCLLALSSRGAKGEGALGGGSLHEDLHPHGLLPLKEARLLTPSTAGGGQTVA